METNHIRQKFLDFFSGRGHSIVSSSPLVPGNDPTLLFTNAGMVQFKNVFLGSEARPYSRAVSAQKCLRAGGKHNDLENVGYTARHHTFFEMLGNFSFGDYFKRDAITYAWQFLTQELAIPSERLWVTVYETDDEAEEIWLKHIGVSPHRISRCGAKDNFWSMGDTGPCGPCTEIFYDHGADIPGGPPGTAEEDGDRYIEIWNLVFMQYNRGADGTLTPLPKPSVDTGMGLERIAAVLQGVHDNYDIDIFKKLIQAVDVMIEGESMAQRLPSAKSTESISEEFHAVARRRRGETEGVYSSYMTEDEAMAQRCHSVKFEGYVSKKVLADHIRSATFLIHEGVLPSNEGRGYVLRRIIRRALRHGFKLGFSESFFHKLVAPVVEVMGGAYPELRQTQAMITKAIQQEEEQFSRTLHQGLKILDQELAELTTSTIPGALVFKLYDTYGFPVDLTADIAREKSYDIDYAGFEHCMDIQRQQSQAASVFSAQAEQFVDVGHYSEFAGYDRLEDEVEVVALLQNGVPVDALSAGQDGWVVLNRTPFYAEGGGQVGDQGQLLSAQSLFEVQDTRIQGTTYLHIGCVKEGQFKVAQRVTAAVDGSKRHATALNHTATHLLHAALRKILGTHVIQKGSLVASDRLRFDFSHYEPLTTQQIFAIEHLVNQHIRAATPVKTELMSPEQAKAEGAMALFGEKYNAQARVLTVGDFSKELCGGTHVRHTGEIGLFKIINESAIAAGIRRIEAITGEAVLHYFDQLEHNVQQASQILNCQQAEFLEKLNNTVQKVKQLEKELQKFENDRLYAIAQSCSQEAIKIQVPHVADAGPYGIDLIVKQYDGFSVKQLRTIAETIKAKGKPVLLVLASVLEGRVSFVVLSHQIRIESQEIRADKLAKHLATYVEGNGGGKADFAQAGGAVLTSVPSALQSVAEWLEREMRSVHGETK